MNKISEFVQHVAAEPSPLVKAVNAAAVFLGVSSFLGLVNLLVGVLSVGWLCLQGWGYIVYELPTKRARRLRAEYMAKARHDRMEVTAPGDLDD